MTSKGKTYPNLFLLGAPKSGTTFIYGLLQNAPDVFTSFEKEPAYFLVLGKKISNKDRLIAPPECASSEEAYCKLYEGQAERYIIDASTHYLSSPETAERIYAVSPDAKIIAILREPISRAYSHYLMGVRDGFVVESFFDALAHEELEMSQPEHLWSEHYRFIRRSLYLDGLRKFYSFFKSNMRIYLFEDIKSNPTFVIDDLCEFLDLPRDKLREGMSQAERNAYAVDRFPAVTRLLQRYRTSSVRHRVNSMTPVGVRDRLRKGYEELRLVRADKPQMDDRARAVLVEALGDDYSNALEFAQTNGILRRASMPALKKGAV